ncbi:hypothetical protein F5X96DRAFT_277559 [Biscogniauxia mediterranea]|nr:hypothetical protein F5X96DRAFT_277559 [Biscogniauxia mediterranea]
MVCPLAELWVPFSWVLGSGLWTMGSGFWVLAFWALVAYKEMVCTPVTPLSSWACWVFWFVSELACASIFRAAKQGRQTGMAGGGGRVLGGSESETETKETSRLDPVRGLTEGILTGGVCRVWDWLRNGRGGKGGESVSLTYVCDGLMMCCHCKAIKSAAARSRDVRFVAVGID